LLTEKMQTVGLSELPRGAERRRRIDLNGMQYVEATADWGVRFCDMRTAVW